jgi:hypothetical protein
MHVAETVRDVIKQYPISVNDEAIQPHGSAGGFSGARFWRIDAENVHLCLRRWPPEHPGEHRLEYIHTVLKHAFERGCRHLAVPLATRAGTSFVRCDGTLWELSGWLPGEAEQSDRPSDRRIIAATESLAEFHSAVEQFGREMGREIGPEMGPAPGLIERERLLAELRGGTFDRIVQEAEGGPLSGYVPRIAPYFRTLAPSLAEALAAARDWEVPLHPCLRDSRRDHFLFTGERVTGLVDFGTLRLDYAGGDIARLLGSLLGDQKELWKLGWNAYHKRRHLNDLDFRLVELYDASNVLMSPLNWLRWIVLEKRRFENMPAVLGSLDAWFARLEHAATRIRL